MSCRTASLGLLLAACLACSAPAAQPSKAFEDGQFAWKASGPLIASAPGHVSTKDPTIVFHNGRWHMYCTLRLPDGRVGMIYIGFDDWKNAGTAPRQILDTPGRYNCAPQLFYFRPHRKWYLLSQLGDPDHKPPFGPVVQTSDDPGDPKSWSRPVWLFNDEVKRNWLDFWIICDDAKAHLFYTSLDGKMWRSETKLADFPAGWSAPALALQADIFEASHTYTLKGLNQYLTIIEAQGGNRRYYKAYLADTLEGPWKPLADTLNRPFAAHGNVRQDAEWTTCISHGELLRSGSDETMEVDPANLRLLFQGASDREYRESGGYGKIPWRLGLLEQIGR